MAFTIVSPGGGIVDWGGGWLARQMNPQNYIYWDVYKYNGVNYLKVTQPGYYWDGYFMSVSNNGYLGVYHWPGATGFHLDNTGHLISEYKGTAVLCEAFNQANYLKADPGLTGPGDDFILTRADNPALYQALPVQA